MVEESENLEIQGQKEREHKIDAADSKNWSWDYTEKSKTRSKKKSEQNSKEWETRLEAWGGIHPVTDTEATSGTEEHTVKDTQATPGTEDHIRREKQWNEKNRKRSYSMYTRNFCLPRISLPEKKEACTTVLKNFSMLESK